MVKAFRCTVGKRRLRPRSISQNQSRVSSGCNPPTMWNSVTASLQPSPAFLADLFPETVRGRVMGLFYLATPVGSALGYLVGGYLGNRYGWRAPFMV